MCGRFKNEQKRTIVENNIIRTKWIVVLKKIRKKIKKVSNFEGRKKKESILKHYLELRNKKKKLSKKKN